MSVRGVRGAINVENDQPEEILDATRELLQAILDANTIPFEEVVSAIFTTTPDLTATFPAEAARAIGMGTVPLLCATEIAVPGAMPKCIRILLHVNTETPQRDIRHVYLRDTARLRPDLNSAQ